MKRTMRNGVLLAVVLLSAAACTRRVQVESEPNEPNYMQSSVAPAEIEKTGVYDYVVDLPNGVITGPMTVTRAADGNYAVHFLMDDGQEVPTRNVRSTPTGLTMDVTTPGGEGAVMLEWVSATEVEGEVFIGETLPFSATRRS